MKIVFCTTPPEAAVPIARMLVEERLVACANIVPGLRSLYWWKGKMDDSRESLLVMKTRDALVGRLIERIRAIHPYEVPEIVSVRVADAFDAYAKWVEMETRPAARVSRRLRTARKGR